MDPLLKNDFPETIEQFKVWEPLDGYKYEWFQGKIFKRERFGTRNLKLVRKLFRCFYTSLDHNKGGLIVLHQDVLLNDTTLCRPDLAYFSVEQIKTSDVPGADDPIPAFAIEVISTTDQILAVKAKLRQYFQHGIQVVWLIYPDDKLVEVYTDFKTVHICSGRDICSAKPVLEDFEIPAEDLFS